MNKLLFGLLMLSLLANIALSFANMSIQNQYNNIIDGYIDYNIEIIQDNSNVLNEIEKFLESTRQNICKK